MRCLGGLWCAEEQPGISFCVEGDAIGGVRWWWFCWGCVAHGGMIRDLVAAVIPLVVGVGSRWLFVHVLSCVDCAGY